MGNVIPFRLINRTLEKRICRAMVEELNKLYEITNGWEFMLQVVEIRQAWEEGQFEI